MPQFSYKARKRSGEVVQGVLDVVDRSAALMQIERLGLFPVAIDTTKGNGAAAAATPGKAAGAAAFDWKAFLPQSLQASLTQQRKPKLQELSTYTQQLANLLSCGMPLTVALNSMTHLETKGIPAEVSRSLRQDVMEGRSLSDAMAKQPRIFSALYVNMVRAGESSGALVDVLRRMADHFERFAQVQSKLSSALIYPAFVVVVGVGVMFFFMSYMLPKFMSIFEGMNMPLPLTTRILIGISHLFAGYWWLMLGLIVGLLIVFKRYQSSPQGQRKIDQWKMNMPVFGKVIKLNLFAQFSSTLSTLLQNGVPVLNALSITEQIIPNIIVREAIARTREEVTDGKTIAQPLARGKVFPQLMVDLIKIGEDTGDVPGALKNVAETYESELAMSLKVMTNMIEPVLIIAMAVLVGFLLMGVLSAMFSITSNIAR